MDLVDEENVALVERGQDRGEIAGALDSWSARIANVDPELPAEERVRQALKSA